MESSIWKQAAKFLRDKKINRRWLMVFVCLAVIVAAGTVTVLKYNGQAMTYKQKVLDCGYQIHKHTASCYDKENKLVCGLADYVVHTHNDDCYSANGKLVCTLPEVKEHQHDSSCYKNESVLICTQAEAASHVHGDSCYTAEQGDLTCGTEAHQHGDGCYDENGELTCTQAEHQHSDACYGVNQVLTCTQEEGAGGHTHTDNCYKTEKVLACGKLENHTHSKTGCYDASGKLTCDKTVLEKHVHSDDCFTVVEMTPEEFAAMSAPGQADDAEDSAEESGIFFTDVDGENAAEAEDSSMEDESKLDEAPEPEYRWMSDSGDDYTVTVAFEEDALPEDVELNVREIAEDTAEYESYYKQTVDTLLKDSEAETEEELELNQLRFFDIMFLVDGEEVEPTKPVAVDISYTDSMASREDQSGVAIHFADDGTELLKPEMHENGYRFIQKSFSVSGVFSMSKDASDKVKDYASYGISTFATDTTTGVTVYFYVAVDEEWIEVPYSGTASITTDSGRYYVSAETLQQVYQGFDDVDQKLSAGTRYFPHATSLTDKVWGDETTKTIGGKVYSPLGNINNGKTTFYVYYLPHAASGSYSGEKAGYVTANTFYSITVDKAKYGKVSGPDYVLTGKNATLILEGTPENWGCTDADAKLEEENGQTKVTLTNVTKPVTLTEKLAEGEYRIKYDINVKDIPTPTGTSFGTEIAIVGNKPTIQQGATYVDVIPETNIASYTTILPDIGYYLVSYYHDGNGESDARYQYQFQGWSLDGQQVIEDQALRETIKTQKDITLKAIWQGPLALYQTVNFYINYSPINLGFAESVSNDDKWTRGLYTAELQLANGEALSSMSPGAVIYGGESGDVAALYEYDANIRKLATGTIKASEGTEYSGQEFKLTRFPTDAEIFAAIKNKNQTYKADTGGKTYLEVMGITEDELTTDNYTIYWNILKGGSNNDDSWHIDGRLVQKKGKLVVKKTFAGAAPMEQLKKTFEINITGTNNAGGKFKLEPLTLTEEPGKRDVAATEAGVSNFTIDEETNTYIWELELPQLVEYTIKEDGYAKDAQDLVCQANYQVLNQPEGNDIGLTEYKNEKGISVKVTNYPMGTPQSGIQTVALENYYVTSNSFLLVKRDDSGELLAGVKFSFMKDDQPIELYRQNANHYYLYQPDAIETTPVNELVTTKNGVTVHGLNEESVRGLYVMVENAQTGYQQLNQIKFEIQEGGGIIGTPGSDKDADWSQVGSGQNAYNLRVKNTSERADFTATKVWGTGAVKKDVTLQLYRNNAPMTGNDYTVTLEADKADEHEWIHTWTDIPTHVGGEKVRYTVREIAIDGKEPSANPSYRITYSDVTETTEKMNSETTTHYMQTVTNELNTGKVTFKKVDAQNDQPLAGAEFELTPKLETGVEEETAQAAETQTYTATSNDKGEVVFDVPPGTYIMKEINAPEGFVESDEEYTVTVTANAGGQNTVSIQNKDGIEINKVKNQVITVPLPESGGPGTTIYTFGAIAIFAMCLVYGCSLRRRRERRTD